MAAIPPDLYNRLRNVLVRCEAFSSYDELRIAFADPRIIPWRNRVPIAQSVAERVSTTISFLYENYNTKQQNALVLFLNVLSESMHPDDERHRDLINFANEFEEVLGPNIEQTITIAADELPADLDLSGQRLSDVPSALFRLTHLERLNLGHNNLTFLPSQIGRLRKLRYLDLSQNRLTSLPPEIRHLPLETLDVRGNPLPIPEELLMLPSRKFSGISQPLYARLRGALSNAQVFESDMALRSIFVDARLSLWRDIPLSTPTKDERINRVIANLLEQRTLQNESAMVLLLQVLADQMDHEDIRRRDLQDLATEMRH